MYTILLLLPLTKHQNKAKFHIINFYNNTILIVLNAGTRIIFKQDYNLKYFHSFLFPFFKNKNTLFNGLL